MLRKASFLPAVLAFLFVGAARPDSIDLPKTGQATCYTEDGDPGGCGLSQDGGVQAGVSAGGPRFARSGDVVTDNLTGLMWTADANLSGLPMVWPNAMAFAGSLNTGGGIGGYTDWRLPNALELHSLMDFGRPDQTAWLGDSGFENVVYGEYWSSTSYNQESAWSAQTGAHAVGGPWGGIMRHRAKTIAYFVWPVRGESTGPARVWKTGQTSTFHPGDDGDLEMGAEWPETRFVPDGDCVIDRMTGLMWPGKAYASFQSLWWEALGLVNVLEFGGHEDWRLPNVVELKSLLNYGYEDQRDAQRASGQIPVQGAYHWSSTSMVADPRAAFVVNFWQGQIHGQGKQGTTAFVLPVRSAGGGGSSGATPSEGTIGTRITVAVAGLGSRKPKVWVGGVPLKVLGPWTGEEVTCVMRKPCPAGSQDLKVDKRDKEADPVVLAGGFTVRAPEIDGFEPPTGAAKQGIVVHGKWFGTQKPKVYLEYVDARGRSRKAKCKVKKGIFMDPGSGSGSISIVLPGKAPPGAHTILVQNKVGEATAAFTVE